MRKVLFCIPYAGSSALMYKKWMNHLSGEFIIIPLELAGRGRRMAEPFYDSFQEAVEDLHRQTLEIDYDLCAIFGHSMGSWLALELAWLLEKQDMGLRHVFVSGNWPPHMQRIETELHTLPDDAFKKAIFEVGGTPMELMESKEIMDFFLPILRADYKILERYEGPKHILPVNVPLTVLNGTQDDVTDIELEGWKAYTKETFNIYHIEGSHFFINENTKPVIDVIHSHYS